MSGEQAPNDIPAENRRDAPVSSGRELLDRIIIIRDSDPDPSDRTASNARIETLLAENPVLTRSLFEDFWREYMSVQLRTRTWKQLKRLENSPPEGDYPQNPVYPLLRQALKNQIGGQEQALERVIQDILDEFEPAT